MAVGAMPGRTKLSTTLLTRAHQKAVISQDKEIKHQLDEGHRIGMVIDGWMSIRKIHVEAIALTAGSCSYLMESTQCGDSHHGVAVAKGWEEQMQMHCLKVIKSYEGATISYVNSDDSGQCGRGRRIDIFV